MDMSTNIAANTQHVKAKPGEGSAQGFDPGIRIVKLTEMSKPEDCQDRAMDPRDTDSIDTESLSSTHSQRSNTTLLGHQEAEEANNVSRIRHLLTLEYTENRGGEEGAEGMENGVGVGVVDGENMGEGEDQDRGVKEDSDVQSENSTVQNRRQREGYMGLRDVTR